MLLTGRGLDTQLVGSIDATLGLFTKFKLGFSMKEISIGIEFSMAMCMGWKRFSVDYTRTKEKILSCSNRLYLFIIIFSLYSTYFLFKYFPSRE